MTNAPTRERYRVVRGADGDVAVYFFHANAGEWSYISAGPDGVVLHAFGEEMIEDPTPRQLWEWLDRVERMPKR